MVESDTKPGTLVRCIKSDWGVVDRSGGVVGRSGSVSIHRSEVGDIGWVSTVHHPVEMDMLTPSGKLVRGLLRSHWETVDEV